MAEKKIITIGRQFGSGGREIGKRVASALGYAIYDKELLKLQAEHSGLAEQVLQSYDENHNSSFLYSIVMDVYPSMNYVGNSLNQTVYQAQYETIRKLGDEGNCVIVGRGADYILRDYPNLISVFIHARMEDRIARVMEYEKVSAEKAEEMIRRADKKRASYYNFLTEKKWGQASEYMLSLDSSSLGYDGCVEMIRKFMELSR